MGWIRGAKMVWAPSRICGLGWRSVGIFEGGPKWAGPS